MTGSGYHLCSSLTDAKCQQGADVQAILPICKSASDQYCVEALNISSKKTADGPATALKTIVCVKGKVVKNVTAVSPKCPAGYKVKK